MCVPHGTHSPSPSPSNHGRCWSCAAATLCTASRHVHAAVPRRPGRLPDTCMLRPPPCRAQRPAAPLPVLRVALCTAADGGVPLSLRDMASLLFDDTGARSIYTTHCMLQADEVYFKVRGFKVFEGLGFRVYSPLGFRPTRSTSRYTRFTALGLFGTGLFLPAPACCCVLSGWVVVVGKGKGGRQRRSVGGCVCDAADARTGTPPCCTRRAEEELEGARSPPPLHSPPMRACRA